MTVESIPAYSELPGRQAGHVYNEAAFRHFLAVDRWRAERSRRSLFLVLVAVRQPSGAQWKLTDATAAALFRGLHACVREIDFVGWYREGYEAGAVLAQGVNPSGDVPQVITERLRTALQKRLSPDQSKNLRLRVIRLNGKVRN